MPAAVRDAFVRAVESDGDAARRVRRGPRVATRLPYVAGSETSRRSALADRESAAVPHFWRISGSLRRGSFNTSLLRAAVELAPEGTRTKSDRSLSFLSTTRTSRPTASTPAVKVVKDQLAAADGLLIATPEYNNSIPGVAKNAIDWRSRPPSDVPRLFRNKPIAIIGATPGQGGTILSQAAWLPILATLGASPWFGGRLRVSGAATVFDANGTLVDEKIRQQLKKFVEGFAAYCGSR